MSTNNRIGSNYLTWAEGDNDAKASALNEFSQAVESFDGFTATEAHFRSPNYVSNVYDFQDIDTNVNVRTGFSRQDYDFFRSNERMPHNKQKIIGACMEAYRKNGLVKNVIDLMGDFACQGITLTHESKSVQRFYQRWFNKVKGKDRSERFLNMLYRAGNVIVKRTTAKPKPSQLKKLMLTIGAPDIEVTPDVKVDKREIPWVYTIFNPTKIDVIGDDFMQVVGDLKRYGIKVQHNLRNKILNPRTPEEQRIVAKLPNSVVSAIRKGEQVIPLDESKTRAFFYKKDDDEHWADPMIWAIYDDIIKLEKTKLADLAALDGVISQVRLWNIGDLEHRIFPNKAIINKLSNILMHNVGGGAIDLIWGPELKFTESSSNAYQFLGKEKYEPILNAIYSGLGVPPTLTGSATASGS